jgi:hypothetical protein
MGKSKIHKSLQVIWEDELIVIHSNETEGWSGSDNGSKKRRCSDLIDLMNLIRKMT